MEEPVKIEMSLDERWPCLVYKEDEEAGVEVPDQLVKKLDKATEALEAAEDAIARWVKYSQPQAAGDIRPLIDRLPAAAERKKR